MGLPWSLLKIFLFFSGLTSVAAEAYSARIETETHVNVVSKNFLSFTVDPKYLFSSGEKYGKSQECICMAASLSPAYLRIAGPSTAHMTFHNSTIAIDPPLTDTRKYFLDNFLGKRKRQASSEEIETPFEENASFQGKVRNRRQIKKKVLEQPRMVLENLIRRHKKRNIPKVKVTSDEWKRFSAWAKATGFEIVFALNNEEKADRGLWDPNTTLDILSVAEKEGVGNIYWQLGYECTNQSIDEYLNDLETLRVLVDTFPGRERGWRVVGADVTSCLREDSKSDFRDYVALSLDMADALMLNGNSSSHELERLSPSERSKLLRTIHASGSPLWVSERPPQGSLTSLERAAAWLASLGHAARRGAQVHFRELTDYELYQPTLSFYMALLFKNLVGERVLNVEMESAHTVLFAHCTSLRHQPVPGAVTLYGANMDDEPARLSLKLSKREEGGDIMQFILSQDENGNIIVNGREMSQEGDIRPVVRRVRPYKTLLLNLPARSFGFWVIANTKIEPCHYDEENKEENLVEAENVDKISKRSKRSVDNESDDVAKLHIETNHVDEYNIVKTGNKQLDETLEKVNNYLREFNKILRKNSSKVKRQAFDGQATKKLRRQLMKIQHDFNKKAANEDKPVLSFIGNLLQFARNGTKYLNSDRLRNLKLHRNKTGNKYYVRKSHDSKITPKRPINEQLEAIKEVSGSRRFPRIRRSIVQDKYENKHEKENFVGDNNDLDVTEKNEKLSDGDSTTEKEVTTDNNEAGSDIDRFYKEFIDKDNEIEDNTKDNKKLWEVLHNIQSQLKKMSEDKSRQNVEIKDKEGEKLVVKTELTEDGASINFKEQPKGGWVKSTFENIFYALDDLNDNMNRFWDALSLFE